MQFASANSSTFVVRNGSFLKSEEEEPNKTYVDDNNIVTMLQLQGTKSMIGSTVRLQDINNQIIILKPEDKIYMFSDGFFDQLGGEKNSRYTKKRFIQLISSMYESSMKQQKSIFEKEFNTWTKENISQLDDIIILGYKIS